MLPTLATVHPGASAAEAGLPVARAYRPCLIAWSRNAPADELLDEMREAGRRRDLGTLLVSLDRATHLLLVPDDPGAPPAPGRVHAALSAALQVALTDGAEAGIRVVVGRRVAPGEDLRVVASRLRRRQANRVDCIDVTARRDGLAWLLDGLDARHASTFVEHQLAALADYDHEHGTNLQRVVELALDHQNRNRAADAAFMHRNTFRRQLRKALSLLDADLDRPEERLALHLALKMRGVRSRTGSPST
jgi:hypothetical protein